MLRRGRGYRAWSRPGNRNERTGNEARGTISGSREEAQAESQLKPARVQPSGHPAVLEKIAARAKFAFRRSAQVDQEAPQ
jgi:hypothetical protein